MSTKKTIEISLKGTGKLHKGKLRGVWGRTEEADGSENKKKVKKKRTLTISQTQNIKM